jgi:hypothetical protein
MPVQERGRCFSVNNLPVHPPRTGGRADPGRCARTTVCEVEMTRKVTVSGAVVILIGLAILVYGQFSYTTEETILDIGPLEATAETRESVQIPPALGWIALGAGGILLAGGLVGSSRGR